MNEPIQSKIVYYSYSNEPDCASVTYITEDKRTHIKEHRLDGPAFTTHIKSHWYVDGVEYFPESTWGSRNQFYKAGLNWLKRIAHISNEDMLHYLKKKKEYDKSYANNT